MKVNDTRNSLACMRLETKREGESAKAEVLTLPFEVKSITDEGVIEGYASTFGNIDLGGDVVDAGAFKKTLRETKGGKVPVLADHMWTAQIGWGIDAKEDERGLWVRAKLDVANNAKAREKFSLAKMAMELKVSAGISIGYRTIKAEPDKENPTVRRLKELRLFEYSLVTFPMNTEASVTAAKSLDAFAAEMRDAGHSEEDIKKFFALPPSSAGAANTNPDPHHVQSVADAMAKTLRILRGK